MRLNFVVALLAEARPIIERYNLQRVSGRSGSYELYRSDSVSLVISGMGKVNAAAATGWLAAQSTQRAVWINTGVCGHGRDRVGSLVVAVKILDTGTEKAWYPPQLIRHDIKTCAVHTVEQIETQYASPVAYEMEASGFYSVASRFSTAEFCQCLKVVSDGIDAPVSRLRIDDLTDLIATHTSSIVDYACQLVDMLATLPVIPDDVALCDTWCSQWHFSVTQRHQLVRHLRHLILLGREDVALASCRSMTNSSEVLNCLADQLQAVPVPTSESSNTKTGDTQS